MDFHILANKVLRHLYLYSGFPILNERLVNRAPRGPSKFRSLDLNRLKEILITTISPLELEKLKKRAEEVRAGWLHIFNEPLLKLNHGVFRSAPRTGRTYGLSHWSRVHIGSAAGDEDVKFIWEVNRLGDLDPLLVCVLLEGDSKYLEEALKLLRQWRVENPFNRGLNWYSNMEVAIRLLRLFLLRGILAAHSFDTREADIAINEHYSHVTSEWRFTKSTMMGRNHLIVEFAAMAMYEFMTEIPGKMCEILEIEAERQFLPDGGYFEGSVGYHVFALNVILFVKWLAYSANVHFLCHASFMQRAMQFLKHLMGSEGSVPGIGDWDDGQLLRPLPKNPRYIKNLIDLGQNLVGSSGTEEFCYIDNWKVLPHSGMAIHRRSNQGIFCFRSASVHHGHSHLDMLSLHYIGCDGPIILDGGTYAYNYSREVRDFYRSPAAHSTLFVEGVMPLQPLRNFAWKGSLTCRLWKNGSRVVGEYDIYALGILRREVIILKDGYEIRDKCPDGSIGWSQYIVSMAEMTKKGIIIKNYNGKPTLLVSTNECISLAKIENIEISSCYGEKNSAMLVRFPVKRNLLTKLKFLD